jgi:hypothetical protein
LRVEQQRQRDAVLGDEFAHALGRFAHVHRDHANARRIARLRGARERRELLAALRTPARPEVQDEIGSVGAARDSNLAA